MNEQDLPRKSGIYQIRNLVNGKVYIGSAVNLKKRWRLHLQQLRSNIHHSIKLQRAYNKYGEDNFVIEIIEIIEDKSLLLEAEQKYIDKYNVVQEGYNICPIAGSSLGVKRSEETRKKIGDIHRGRTWSEETRQKYRQARLGSHITEEHRQHIIEGKQFIREETREKLRNTPNCKPVVCLETRERYRSASEAARAHNASKGRLYMAINKKDNSALGLHWVYESEYVNMSEEDIQQILSQPAKIYKVQVRCIETGHIFNSTTEAAKFVNRTQTCIVECCQGKQKTCGCFHWEYVS